MAISDSTPALQEAPSQKTCVACRQSQPLEAFSLDRARRDGKCVVCRVCAKARARASYLARRETILAQEKATRAALTPEEREQYLTSRRENDRRWREKNREEERIRLARYRQEHQEELRLKQALWRKNHPDKERAKAQKWRKAHPESMRAQYGRWILRHRDEAAARSRTRYARNRQRLIAQARAYQRAHPEVTRLNGSRRRARKRSLPDTFTAEEYQFLLTYWGYACAACGKQEGFMWTLVLDHWHPLSMSDCPGTIATNMMLLCHGDGGCNNTKHNLDPNLWLARRFGKRQATKIAHAIATYFALVAQRADMQITPSRCKE